jgi:hypothetical protein
MAPTTTDIVVFAIWLSWNCLSPCAGESRSSAKDLHWECYTQPNGRIYAVGSIQKRKVPTCVRSARFRERIQNFSQRASLLVPTPNCCKEISKKGRKGMAADIRVIEWITAISSIVLARCAIAGLRTSHRGSSSVVTVLSLSLSCHCLVTFTVVVTIQHKPGVCTSSHPYNIIRHRAYDMRIFVARD